MIRRAASAAVVLLLFLSCGGGKPSSKGPLISNEPVSVRGWIADVANAPKGEPPEVTIGRLTQMFNSTSVWVENAPYASGGVAGNGSFILLDVPPGTITIGFNAPGAETAQITLQNIPGSADVLIPAIILAPHGGTVFDPKAIRVRIPSTTVKKDQASGAFAVVAGHRVPVVTVPLGELVDRRDYPNPGGLAPVATVR